MAGSLDDTIEGSIHHLLNLQSGSLGLMLAERNTLTMYMFMMGCLITCMIMGMTLRFMAMPCMVVDMFVFMVMAMRSMLLMLVHMVMLVCLPASTGRKERRST